MHGGVRDCNGVRMSAVSRTAGLAGWEACARVLPGLALSAGLGWLALRLAEHAAVQAAGLSGLSLAIVLGMLVGNLGYARVAAQAEPGVVLSKQHLLRLGIVLYGLRLTVQDVVQVGMAGVLIDAVVVGATFVLAVWMGTRWLGLERSTAMLIGAGSSICGAAAVLAAEPVVKGRAEQVAVAVATVVVFGTVATFLYPALYALAQHAGWLAGGERAFGIYIGSTVHEVAQVVAAGNAIGAQAADTAVIAKMVRVMMLAPFLLALSAWLVRHPDAARRASGATQGATRVTVPWFAVGFVAVVAFNSLQWLPQPVTAAATALDNHLLAMAMAALGLTTHVSAIRKAGVRPLLLALLLFGWLVVGGALLNQAVQGWLG